MMKSDSDQASNTIDGKDKEKVFAKKQKSMNQWLKERDDFAKKQKDQEKRFNVGLDFTKCGVRQVVNNELSNKAEDEFYSPELSLSYRW